MIKLLLVIGVSAAMFYVSAKYLLTVDREFSAQLSDKYESQEMRHVYTKFVLANTTPAGTTKYLLHSPKTVVLLSEKKTHLDLPNMVFYRDEQKPVAITADEAVIDHALNVTTLSKNVEVKMPTQGKESAVLKTEKLFFDSVSEFAYTDQYAKIVQGKSLMEGVGLEYSLEKQNIKFLDKVRGTYEK